LRSKAVRIAHREIGKAIGAGKAIKRYVSEDTWGIAANQQLTRQRENAERRHRPCPVTAPRVNAGIARQQDGRLIPALTLLSGGKQTRTVARR
jgi:hypothetical protein